MIPYRCSPRESGVAQGATPPVVYPYTHTEKQGPFKDPVDNTSMELALEASNSRSIPTRFNITSTLRVICTADVINHVHVSAEAATHDRAPWTEVCIIQVETSLG